MAYEEDWFMQQIKGAGNVIGAIMHLQKTELDLGMVEDEEGKTVDGRLYLTELLESEQFEQAFDFISAQMKCLPFPQYEILVEEVITYIERLPEDRKKAHEFSEEALSALKKKLLEFLW
ncbi:hypothetical protein [Streptococcus massiliensis]|uniref:Uncharacterized protein n=1 Tax=Streptococcus massiliensis TaxID=313439 RepID=A0A380KXB3_9STRE|nr:hypothetical protein [Streptococcus massiliensis]SUN75774.1 Uncharacterised protein [Streptococcus massiliensis]